MIYKVKGFDVINKAKVDVFLELSCFFDGQTDAGNLLSGFSAFSKSSLNIWKFSIHVLLKPGLENFEHYFASVCFCWCCQVASVVSDSVRPHIRQPTRLPVPGILQARTLEWVPLPLPLLACEMSATCSSLNILWHYLSLGLEWKLTFHSIIF